LAYFAHHARKWSDSKKTPLEVKACNDKIIEMREATQKTSKGRKMIKDRMVAAYNELLPAGKDSLGWEEFKKMTDSFAPMHDSLAGGHWI